MTGIFPNSGVPASQASQAQVNPEVVPGCEPLYNSSTRCQPRFDPSSANALISEIVNLVNCSGEAYDCARLDNLCTSVTALIDQRIALLPPDGLSTRAVGEPGLAEDVPLVPNMSIMAQTTPSPLVNIAGGSVEVEEGTYELSGAAAVYFQTSAVSGQLVPYFVTTSILINGVLVQTGTGLSLSRVGLSGAGTTIATIAPAIRRINAGDLVTMEVRASTNGSGAAQIIRLVPAHTYLTMVKLEN